MKINKSHIGREVVLRNGSNGFITEIRAGLRFPVRIMHYLGASYVNTKGRIAKGMDCPFDVIKFRTETKSEWKKRALAAENNLSILTAKLEKLAEQLRELIE